MSRQLECVHIMMKILHCHNYNSVLTFFVCLLTYNKDLIKCPTYMCIHAHLSWVVAWLLLLTFCFVPTNIKCITMTVTSEWVIMYHISSNKRCPGINPVPPVAFRKINITSNKRCGYYCKFSTWAHHGQLLGCVVLSNSCPRQLHVASFLPASFPSASSPANKPS